MTKSTLEGGGAGMEVHDADKDDEEVSIGAIGLSLTVALRRSRWAAWSRVRRDPSSRRRVRQKGVHQVPLGDGGGGGTFFFFSFSVLVSFPGSLFLRSPPTDE